MTVVLPKTRSGIWSFVAAIVALVFILNFHLSGDLFITNNNGANDASGGTSTSTRQQSKHQEAGAGTNNSLELPPIVYLSSSRAREEGGPSSNFHPVFVYSNVAPPRRRSYSQVAQDLILLKLTQAEDEKSQPVNSSVKNLPHDHAGRFFVDLAANDATSFSNTMHLEQNGWNGLCIEPNPMYWYRLASLRKCMIVGSFVGGKEDGKEVDVVLSNRIYGGIVGEGFDNENKKAEEKRNLVSISTVFHQTQVPKVIDYMSLDVEGAEYLVMQDFPFQEYKIKFITIERPKDELKQLLASNGYQEISQMLSSWGETLWFNKELVGLAPEEVEEIACNQTTCTTK